jgi:hypothetical protein
VSTPLWAAIISSVSALLGVAVGGFRTARVQKRQWARGQQIEACAVIVVESTRVQLSLRGQWKHDQRVDWVPWNEALAKISLVADWAVVEAAGEVDAVFWRHSDRIDRGEVTDEAAWFEATGPMEAARLAFVNTAKRHVLRSADRLDRLPIRRPSGYMPGVDSTPPSPPRSRDVGAPRRSPMSWYLSPTAARRWTPLLPGRTIARTLRLCGAQPGARRSESAW